MIDYIVAAMVFLFTAAVLGLYVGMMDSDMLCEMDCKNKLQPEVTQAWIEWSLSRMYFKQELYVTRSSSTHMWLNVNYPLAKEIHDGRQHEGDVGKDRSTSGQ